MYYWLITLWSGETIRVKPQNADYVKRKHASGEGVIATSTRSISVKDIKSFEETDVRYVDPGKSLGAGSALEDASRAFKEAMENEDGDVICKPVKRSVTRKTWEQRYSQIPGHHMINEEDERVIMGMWVPVHLIDYGRVDDCTPEEAERMK